MPRSSSPWDLEPWTWKFLRFRSIGNAHKSPRGLSGAGAHSSLFIRFSHPSFQNAFMTIPLSIKPNSGEPFPSPQRSTDRTVLSLIISDLANTPASNQLWVTGDDKELQFIDRNICGKKKETWELVEKKKQRRTCIITLPSLISRHAERRGCIVIDRGSKYSGTEEHETINMQEKVRRFPSFVECDEGAVELIVTRMIAPSGQFTLRRNPCVTCSLSLRRTFQLMNRNPCPSPLFCSSPFSFPRFLSKFEEVRVT